MDITEYKPKKYIPDPWETGDSAEDIDVDASNDGDYVVCATHQNEIIYVFGTDFWRKEGGTSGFGWGSLEVKGWCRHCQKTHKIMLGSWGG